jgi:hypothetical protein
MGFKIPYDTGDKKKLSTIISLDLKILTPFRAYYGTSGF